MRSMSRANMARNIWCLRLRNVTAIRWSIRRKKLTGAHVNPIGPRSVYDEAKRFTEAVTMAYHRYYKVDTRIVRIFNTYGPRMQVNDGRVIPNFMKQALRGEDLTVYGDGSQTRSFCYVSDEIDGFMRLSKSAEHWPVNIGNPTEFTILECAKHVLAVTGSKSQIRIRSLATGRSQTAPAGHHQSQNAVGLGTED